MAVLLSSGEKRAEKDLFESSEFVANPDTHLGGKKNVHGETMGPKKPILLCVIDVRPHLLGTLYR